MAPVARPAITSCKRSVMARGSYAMAKRQRSRRPASESAEAAPQPTLRIELGQRLRDDLFALFHLGEKRDAVDLARVVPRRLDEDARYFVGRNRQAMQRRGDGLGVEFAGFLCRGLDHVGRD